MARNQVKKSKITVRNANMNDLEALLKLEEIAWEEGSRADKETYILRLETFPEGIFIGERDGEIEGVAVTQIISSEELEEEFTWESITDGGKIKGTHNPHGDVVYGVNLSVKPDGIGNKVISAIMESIAMMAIERNLKWGVLGGRLPGLRKYLKKKGYKIEEMSESEKDKVAMEYMSGCTEHGRPLDPEIAIYKRSGLKPIRPIRNYFPDHASLDYGVLLVWENPFYKHNVIRKIMMPILGCVNKFYKFAA